jgi:hypothetical protein
MDMEAPPLAAFSHILSQAGTGRKGRCLFCRSSKALCLGTTTFFGLLCRARQAAVREKHKNHNDILCHAIKKKTPA